MDFSLGAWLVRPELNSLVRGRETRHVTPKAMDVLVCLARREGRVVSKDDIHREVWPGTFVSDDALTRCIAELRRALRDSSRDPEIVGTVTRRGYRVLATVRWDCELPRAPGFAAGAAVSAAAPAPASPIGGGGADRQAEPSRRVSGARDGADGALTIGKAVSHYRVIEKLGGGMGVVYKAEDTRLGRLVALKVLPEHLTRDPQSLERFEREARATSALNHPGICTVHDVDEHDGRPFIAMELLEGQTLLDRIAGRPLSVDTLLDIAIQITDALDAAHERGIVHRDIKPANVFVTTRGQAKLLDFGLAMLAPRHAKGAEPSTAPPRAAQTDQPTRPGTALGTVEYMSPEQVRGETLDSRTDLFSLGVVLYEMAAGRQAFAGATSEAVFASILNGEPPPLATANPSAPDDLARIIGKALEKDRELRCQTAAELRTDLRRLKRDSGSAAAARAATPAPGAAGGPASAEAGAPRVASPLRRPGSAAVLALCGLTAATLVLWLRPPAVPHVTSIRQVTHDGTTKYRVFTDGTRVYYSGVSGVSVKALQVAVTGGDAVPLETPLRRPYIHDILPRRNELLVEDDVRWTRPDPLWVLSTTGGSARPLGDVEADNSAWSGDGQLIVFSKGKDIYAARGDGSGSRRLLTAPATVRSPRLSPDGQRLRYTLVDMATTSLWEAAPDGSGAHVLLPGWNAGYGGWTPDGRYYVFAAIREGASALWARPESGRWPWSRTPSPEPSKLDAGPMSYFAPALGPDGRTIVALGRPPSGGGELARYDSASRLFVPFLGGLSARDVEFSRDGRWIAYVRQPDGTLWRSRPNGTERRQLTFPPLTAVLPRWSPDGRRIAYMSFSPGGTWESDVVSAEGGKPHPVRDQTGDEDPTWSPDGTRLVVGGLVRDNTAEHPIAIRVVDVATGKASVVPGSEGLFSPRWSPDGRSIVALSADSTRLALFGFATGRWRDLVVGGRLLGYPSWTRDGSRIQVLDGDLIVRVRATDGDVEPVARVERVGPVVTPGSWSWVGIAPDDSPLVCREMSGTVEVYAFDVEWP